MYFLKSRLRLPPPLEVPRTGLEHLFMSKAFLRAYMSQQLRDMEPLEKAVLIPSLIVGNDHGAADFAFNPCYLGPSETIGISMNGLNLQWIDITRPFNSKSPAVFSGFCYVSTMLLIRVGFRDGEHTVLSTIHPSKLFKEYKKTQEECEKGVR